MNNCLVTQLKEATNNKNLPVFNGIRVRFHETSGGVGGNWNTLQAAVGKSVIVDNLENGTINVSSTSITTPYTIGNSAKQLVVLKFGDEDVYYIIKNANNLMKFEISNTSTWYVDLSDFECCTRLEKLALTRPGNHVTGNVNSLKNSLLLTLVEFSGTGITGSLDELIQYHAIHGQAKQLTIRANSYVTIEGSTISSGSYRYITIVSNTQYRVSTASDFSGGNVWNLVDGEWVKQV